MTPLLEFVLLSGFLVAGLIITLQVVSFLQRKDRLER